MVVEAVATFFLGALSAAVPAGILGWRATRQRNRVSEAVPHRSALGGAMPPALGPGRSFDVFTAPPAELTPGPRLDGPEVESLSRQLQASADAFSHRLEHASQNLLQSVEGMRAAADGLSRGTTGLDAGYARLEAIYARFEPLADRLTDSQAMQQQQLGEMAAGLFGITQSLTTVVASANQSQAAVGQVAVAVAEAVSALQETAGQLERSVDRLTTAWEETHGAGSETATSATPRESVTLRLMVEQQQQFINMLDQRLSPRGRSALLSEEPARGYSSSSSSSSSSSDSSSSMTSSSAAKRPPARALSNHSM